MRVVVNVIDAVIGIIYLLCEDLVYIIIVDNLRNMANCHISFFILIFFSLWSPLKHHFYSLWCTF